MNSNLKEWMESVLFKAGIVDRKYIDKIGGMETWLPYGVKIRNRFISIIKEILNNEYEEYLFPTLIPWESLKKEKETGSCFMRSLFWAMPQELEDIAEEKIIEIKTSQGFVLTPTSETIIYSKFKDWVENQEDLPIKLYQIRNVFRYEKEDTLLPLIRVREITTFVEIHTAHATKKEAKQEIEKEKEIIKKLCRILKIPGFITIRPEWDRFPGAIETYSFDTILLNGKTVQIATIHYLGQNFSKKGVFDIGFKNKNGDTEYAYQTTFGFSERVIGAVLALYYDKKGIVLPPAVAPIQVIFIAPPRLKKDKKLGEIVDNLNKSGIRAKTDFEDKDIGEKHLYWRLRGVPIRIEVKESIKREYVIIRRDKEEKREVTKEIEKIIPKILDELEENIEKKGREIFNKFINYSDNLEETKKILREKGGVVFLPWCGSRVKVKDINDPTEWDNAVKNSCDAKVFKEIVGRWPRPHFEEYEIGYKILGGIEMSLAEKCDRRLPKDVSAKKCIICKKSAKQWLIVASTI